MHEITYLETLHLKSNHKSHKRHIETYVTTGCKQLSVLAEQLSLDHPRLLIPGVNKAWEVDVLVRPSIKPAT